MADESDGVGHGQLGALAALQEVAEAADRSKFGIAVDSFEPEDYVQIIGLAWRYQFDDNRSKFKRELRDLQEHVGKRILARLDLNE